LNNTALICQKQKRGGWLYYNIITQMLVETNVNPESLSNHLSPDKKEELFFAKKEEELYEFNKKLSGRILSELNKSINLYTSFTGEEIVYLTLWYDCNFKCPYCYQQYDSFQKTGDDQDCLDVEKSLLVIERKSSNGNNPPRQIHLYGGEPLLNNKHAFETIERILKRVHKMMPNIELMVTTNGYNLNHYLHLFSSFPSFKWRFSVTIGVSEEQHRKTRILRKDPNNSTLRTILDNIILISNSLENVHFKIRFNCKEDEEDFSFLIDTIQEIDEKSVLIDVIEIRTIIPALRKPTIYSHKLLNSIKRITNEFSFSSKVKFSLPYHLKPLLSSVFNELSTSNNPPYLCDAVVKNKVLEIDPPFQIQMCELVPDLFSLNSKQEIETNQFLLEKINDKKEKQCLNCPFLIYCFGEVCKVIQFLEEDNCYDIMITEVKQVLSYISNLSLISS